MPEHPFRYAKEPFCRAEYNTNCLEKNPIKGGIPAIENKDKAKDILRRGLLKNNPLSS